MPTNKDTERAVRKSNMHDKKKHQKKYKKRPACMYFYYMTTTDDAAMRHYYYTHGGNTIQDAEVEGIIQKLTANARANGSNPPQCGEGERYIVWSRKSYIAVVIDDSAVTFEADHAVSVHPETANHTFFDGWTGKVNMPSGPSPIAAFYCINHMKLNQNGEDLDEDVQSFAFRMHVVGAAQPRQFPDSGGTNMGPPVPPP
ncbi:MAG TPA: hypothetical protein VK403_03285 [Allosphingosinicella sp.]|nr:hypothetical protein [Allosphingosinicella sp.]